MAIDEPYDASMTPILREVRQQFQQITGAFIADVGRMKDDIGELYDRTESIKELTRQTEQRLALFQQSTERTILDLQKSGVDVSSLRHQVEEIISHEMSSFKSQWELDAANSKLKQVLDPSTAPVSKNDYDKHETRIVSVEKAVDRITIKISLLIAIGSVVGSALFNYVLKYIIK